MPHSAGLVIMLVLAPKAMRSKQTVLPSSPSPTTAEGEKRSPSMPVMNDPPAYVNMKPLSMAVTVRGDTPACMSATFTLV